MLYSQTCLMRSLLGNGQPPPELIQVNTETNRQTEELPYQENKDVNKAKFFRQATNLPQSVSTSSFGKRKGAQGITRLLCHAQCIYIAPVVWFAFVDKMVRRPRVKVVSTVISAKILRVLCISSESPFYFFPDLD